MKGAIPPLRQYASMTCAGTLTVGVDVVTFLRRQLGFHQGGLRTATINTSELRYEQGTYSVCGNWADCSVEMFGIIML